MMKYKNIFKGLDPPLHRRENKCKDHSTIILGPHPLIYPFAKPCVCAKDYRGLEEATRLKPFRNQNKINTTQIRIDCSAL